MRGEKGFLYEQNPSFKGLESTLKVPKSLFKQGIMNPQSQEHTMPCSILLKRCCWSALIRSVRSVGLASLSLTSEPLIRENKTCLALGEITKPRPDTILPNYSDFMRAKGSQI